MFITSNKIFYHPEKVYRTITGDPEAPVCVDLHLSNRCNNACQYCGAVKSDAALMTQDVIKQSIEFIKYHEIKSVVLTGGGEPTINEHFPDVVKSLYSAGIDVGVITNGVKFSQETIEQVIPLVKWIRVSLDASDPTTYKAIRGTDHYYTVIDNIKAMMQYKRSIMASCTIGVQIVVNEHNLKFKRIYDQIMSELPDISYIHIRPIEVKLTEFTYTADQLVTIKGELDDLKGKPKLLLSDKWALFYGPREFGFRRCYAANPVNVIDPHGNIYLCCHHITNPKYKLGNVCHKIGYLTNKKITFNTLGGGLGFNPAECPVGCRGSQINIAIETMLKEPHKNFL